ncbi:MAG TPA: hypothetical protein VFH47_07280 [Candidatus Thermoplasmatota archaeon]|nr:hypothetical protein [Candidatus Thermoplasmatota archaeon]
MEARAAATLTTPAVAVLALLSLVTPWWMVTSTLTTADGQASSVRLAAQPFRADMAGLQGIVPASHVLAVGVLVCGAIVLAAIATALVRSRRPAGEAMVAALLAGVLLVAAAVLAPATWRFQEVGFWHASEQQAVPGQDVQTSLAAPAHVGWYLALAGAVLAFVSAALLLLPREPRPTQAGAERSQQQT